MIRAAGEVDAIAGRLMDQPGGMTTKQLSEVLCEPSANSASRISAMVKAGKAFGATHLDAPRHYFRSRALADLWLREQRQAHVARKRVYVPTAKQNITIGAKKPKGVAKVSGEAIKPRHVVPQVIPAKVDTRFLVPADFKGEFSRAGIGRDVNGKEWA